MKKMSVVAASCFGVLAVSAGAASLAAASDTPATDNLTHTPVVYWCDKGTPNFAVRVHTTTSAEEVTVTSLTDFSDLRLGEVTRTHAAYVYSLKNVAGKNLALTFKGETTGSTFSVNAHVPATCAGLPSRMPYGPKPAAPTSATATSSPAAPASAAAPTTPTAKPHAATTAKPSSGPKVNTDLQGAPTNHNPDVALAAGALAIVGIGTGIRFATRR